MSSIPIIHQTDKLRRAVSEIRDAGRTVGLVPTMGALHDGHLSLVQRSNHRCDATIVTIFVNPTQFGPEEDFERYPRTLPADLERLGQLDVDLVFAPDPSELYPPGFSTYVEPPTLAETLEGACRPGHFRGVTTIVMKLFQLVLPDVSFFGQKDYQQAAVIQQMVRDLDVPVAVEICPIIREPDGLAMSSRNRYLSSTEREQALAIFRGLQSAAACVRDGEQRSSEIERRIRAEITHAGIDDIEYIAIVDSVSLEPVEEIRENVVALVAATVGSTRLIDNHILA